jgi:hypothetical protein
VLLDRAAQRQRLGGVVAACIAVERGRLERHRRLGGVGGLPASPSTKRMRIASCARVE